MCQNDYDLKRKPITTRNPHSDAIIEWIHKIIVNIIRKFDVTNIVNNNPRSGILAATMFFVRATYHTSLQASPMQLLFGRDAILNINHVANWENIRQQKQEWINCNKERKNIRHNNHQYKVSDKILVKRKKNSNPKLKFMGPSLITQIIKCIKIRDYKKVIKGIYDIFITLTIINTQ